MEGELTIKVKSFESIPISTVIIIRVGTCRTGTCERARGERPRVFDGRLIAGGGVTRAGPVIEACVPLTVREGIIDAIRARQAHPTRNNGKPKQA